MRASSFASCNTGIVRAYCALAPAAAWPSDRGMTTAVATNPGRLLRIADGWFRAWGSICLIALALTGVLLLLHAEAWRAAFVLGHLCALIALAPLGVVLVGRTYLRYARERASLLDAARAT